MFTIAIGCHCRTLIICFQLHLFWFWSCCGTLLTHGFNWNEFQMVVIVNKVLSNKPQGKLTRVICLKIIYGSTQKVIEFYKCRPTFIIVNNVTLTFKKKKQNNETWITWLHFRHYADHYKSVNCTVFQIVVLNSCSMNDKLYTACNRIKYLFYGAALPG